MNKLLVSVLLAFLPISFFAQEESPQEAYTRVIMGRADKIVDAISFNDDSLKLRVRNIIMDHYRFLNDQQEMREADVEKIREEFSDNVDLKNAKIDLRKAEQEFEVRNHHFAFTSELKVLITEEHIDQVKDGLTYNVCPNTYAGYIDMIPDLSEEEKEKILIWLIEAREHAIDAGSSKKKHGWFGKYKGRINNYLSKRGYDLNKLSKEWHERLKKEGKKL